MYPYFAHICVLRRIYKCTGIKIYKYRVCSKYPLKMQNKVIELSHANFGFSTIPFLVCKCAFGQWKIKNLN